MAQGGDGQAIIGGWARQTVHHWYDLPERDMRRVASSVEQMVRALDPVPMDWTRGGWVA